MDLSLIKLIETLTFDDVRKSITSLKDEGKYLEHIKSSIEHVLRTKARKSGHWDISVDVEAFVKFVLGLVEKDVFVSEEYNRQLKRWINSSYADLRRKEYEKKKVIVILWLWNSIKGADMFWAAFSNALSLFYQKMGINIMTHSAARVLSAFAVSVLDKADLLDDYIADSYSYAYNTPYTLYSSAPGRDSEAVGSIKKFVNASEFFDVDWLRRSFEVILFHLLGSSMLSLQGSLVHWKFRLNRTMIRFLATTTMVVFLKV
uniref:Uncharacterized protein n=1 Tax=Meloidogyne enterolobii TaxID=390850 RepID=A0A6V7W6U7_MELEN|nr:unnamed protein product [Meloidogyne enterolobii]